MHSLLRIVRPAFVVTVALACALTARANEPPLPQVRCIADLECLSVCDLDRLYRCAQPGPMPCGFLRGKSFFLPDQRLACLRERCVNSIWRGKHFDPHCCRSLNQFSWGSMIRSQLYYGESWLDGKPSIILDYRKSSLLWFDVRDEMRMIAPGLYLGAMVLDRRHGPQQRLFFALEECHHGCR